MSDVDKGAGTMFAPVFTGGENLNRVIAAALATLLSFGVFASEPVVDETLVAGSKQAATEDDAIAGGAPSNGALGTQAEER